MYTYIVYAKIYMVFSSMNYVNFVKKKN